jgi:hypothetical protein
VQKVRLDSFRPSKDQYHRSIMIFIKLVDFEDDQTFIFFKYLLLEIIFIQLKIKKLEL